MAITYAQSEVVVSLVRFLHILLSILRVGSLTVWLGVSVWAQPVHSPYTAQEIGEFSSAVLATNLGMGQVGVALEAPGSAYGSDPYVLQPALLSSNVLTQLYLGMSSDLRRVRSLAQQRRYSGIQLGLVLLSVSAN